MLNRETSLFSDDIRTHSEYVQDEVSSSSFLVIGGAGTIGQAVVKEIFKRNPKRLHVVDISENNLVELVRDLRSTLGYIDGDFKTFAIDVGSIEFHAMLKNRDRFDYVLNLSALKHVRSEKDPYTLMRLIDVNIFNTVSSLQASVHKSAKKYFCVSTDKAANPVNMMGASKRIMEMFLMRESLTLPVTTARFANVAFSDGSLLHGFNQRFLKFQPISAPNDVRRYFVSPQEAGELCLISCIFGDNRDIFFPKLGNNLKLTYFSDLARRYLQGKGFEPIECKTEQEARERAKKLISDKKWPVYFFKSETTGEKSFEEFYTEAETLDLAQFKSIGIIKNRPLFDHTKLENFTNEVKRLKSQGEWDKDDLLEIFKATLPELRHKETGQYLDNRM